MPPRGKAKLKEVRIGSWRRFIDLVTGDTYKNWAFRGQADATWPLNSTISRYLVDHRIKKHVWIHQEERIIRIFQRKAYHFLEHLPDPHDTFRWLAMMQHHGAPTRLLDLTWSPYVAAFFALERATEPAAVWAFDAAGIECRTPQELSREGFEHDVDPHALGDIEEHLLLKGPRVLFIGEPRQMNQRLIAQSGTFAVQGAVGTPAEQILLGYPNGRELLVKLVLNTAQMRREAMRELYNMNLTQATLFPGLDGLARSLAYELEFHWAFDPHNGRLHRGYVWHEDEDGRRTPTYD